MMRFLLALAALAIGGGAQAQLLPVSAALSPRRMPPNVSVPAVTSSSVSYPGCPGEVITHTHTVYFDQVNGHTQAGGGLGTLAAPWDNLQALTGDNAGTPTTGYTQILLSTAPGGNGSSPVVPGDLIIVNTGSYGTITLGASTQIVNNPAITIQAGAGQTPLLTGLYTNKGTGYHFNGLKVQSQSLTSAVIVGISDNGVASSDVILENMDISSASIGITNGWTRAQWIANSSQGIYFAASNYTSTGSAPLLTCVSIVNSHIYGLHASGQIGAIEDRAGSTLVQGNEIDHFHPSAVLFYESNVAIGHNYIHDFVETSEGQQHYAIFNNQDGPLNPAVWQSNIYLYNNKSIESVDPSQTLGPAPSSLYLNSTGDITNFVAWDNLAAGNNECGVCTGNSHDFVVANNSIMYTGGAQSMEMNLSQGHAGAGGRGTGPIGRPPSNGWIFNNIAPIYNNANNLQTYHNIAAPGVTGFSNWNYFNVWSEVFASPTPGSVITLPSIAGQQNLLDGVGANPQTNEFTTVGCTTTPFPCSPQPDWTPKVGSPAKTAGAVQLIPALPDYNGVTPNNSIGALN